MLTLYCQVDCISHGPPYSTGYIEVIVQKPVTHHSLEQGRFTSYDVIVEVRIQFTYSGYIMFIVFYIVVSHLLLFMKELKKNQAYM